MTFDDLLSQFAQPTKSGEQWLVRCPAHADEKASLAIRQGERGIVLHCHAGCDTKRVLGVLGLSERDLFGQNMSPRRQVAVYDYRDETNELLYQVVRFEPKDFRQRRPDGRDGWIWNLTGVRRIPYRLPEIVGREAIVVCEGEKDVDQCWSMGIPATCNLGGAGKWRAEYSGLLKGNGVQRVRIIPDNDAAGRAHAHQVAKSLRGAGLDGRIVDLPDLPDKGDLSDYLACHTKTDLLALLKESKPFTPASPGVVTESVQFTGLSDLLSEPDDVVEWVVQDRISLGSLVLLAGKPKAGKSTLARDLALQVARGSECLGWACTAGPVWYVALEDKRSEVRKHFRRMGANGREPVRFVFPQRVDDLLAKLHAFAEKEKPLLVVVDTLQRLIGARDLNDYAEVTTKLTPVLALARETGAAVVLVHHAGKGDRSGIDAVLGSTALAGSVDNILLYSRTDKYRLLSSQQRIGPDLAESIVTLDEDTGRVALGAARHDADVAELKANMLAVLKEAAEALTEGEVGKLVEGRGTVKRDALRALVRDGTIARAGSGRKGDPFRYAVSRSLVPVSIWEQETEKSKTAETPDEMGLNARSREFRVFADSLPPPEQENNDIAVGDGRARTRF